MTPHPGATTRRDSDQDDVPELHTPETALLSVVHCPNVGPEATELELESQRDLLVGRDVDEGVRLPDPRLSRLHFRVVWDPAGRAFRIGDCDSSNGTFVNGERVRSRILQHGDVVRCGDSVLVFENQPLMQDVRARAQRYAKTILAAILEGETGVGKEVLAKSIHEQSGVPGPFVAVNCATLSRDLAAAELFGHTKGAFSGAAQAREGLFVSADRGTLLLDEIGDLPLDVQPALLRVLEEGALRPVGSDQLRQVRVRVLAATHVDLDEASEAGSFRQDLLARLGQVRIKIPPLRERRSEVLTMFRDFAEAMGMGFELSANAAEALVCWHYPFNVRELKSIVSALAALPTSARVDLARLSAVDNRLTQAGSFRGASDAEQSSSGVGFRRAQLQQLLEQHEGNVSRVAECLDTNRSQVYRWMKALSLSADRYRR